MSIATRVSVSSIGIRIEPKRADAGEVAERALDRLSDDDGGVLGGVVEIDVQVALRAHLQIDRRMPGKALQHVVEKADPRVDVVNARTVEIDGGENLRLAGLAFNGSGAHGSASNRVGEVHILSASGSRKI
jgi:hypothetical protein